MAAGSAREMREAMVLGRVIGGEDKGLPVEAAGLTVGEYLATKPELSEFWTPLLVLSEDALQNNVRYFADWVADRGLELMPHGKTTMAPQLWQQQLDAGATGITVANPSQLKVARAHGFETLMLANQLADQNALRWVAGELEHPECTIWSWVDSTAAVRLAEEALRGLKPSRPLSVLVELGSPGKRTGCRTVEEALAVAEAVAASPVLRLAGVAGYEGALGHDRNTPTVELIRGYVADLLELHGKLAHLYDGGDVLVTCGGSNYPEIVGDLFAEARQADSARYVLRSGAYITHDDGAYRALSPFDRQRVSGRARSLVPAAHGLSRVLSQPEPGLALLDGGRRDFPYDSGYPVPQAAVSAATGQVTALEGAVVDDMNDQHSFLRTAAGQEPAVGDLVVLGLSHPCTTFDKWRLIPTVKDLVPGKDAVIKRLVETYF
ncbi:amino acid aldolase or racemase-like protein (D-serine dehydratase) [Arthrobacter crystallopoietes BAB-32]|uniref:Amino acid aldolase or racemase-like protein (D-serine dehydratase) n=1 Tax=Arthrobacter crystallopoietes BAB-32 TaxID=1246476 RepID=N1V207_9MICC|nr:alanine racemase [Arthrobacter crystallopoietes]EMY34117.1 amino acid aldolase or racemase-like protein (D-serine dehydratase) [Arthrobacter crystallopoietes BAB-32]